MTAALVVAAGSGERLGASAPKALVVCGGKPLLTWSLESLAAVPEITEVVVALPAGVIAADVLPSGVTGVPGGRERSHSVRAALAAVAGNHDLVVVHDAARPLITSEEITRVLQAVRGDVDGAIAAAPVTDTIKVAGGEDRMVERTLDRSALWSVQTPQVFRRAVLERVLGPTRCSQPQPTTPRWSRPPAGAWSSCPPRPRTSR